MAHLAQSLLFLVLLVCLSFFMKLGGYGWFREADNFSRRSISQLLDLSYGLYGPRDMPVTNQRII